MHACAVGRQGNAATPPSRMGTEDRYLVGGLMLVGFIAPMLLDGLDGEVFQVCAAMLAPALRPGDIVMWTIWPP